MAYTTAAALRAYLAPVTLTASDATIGTAITEFEEVAEDYLGRAYQVRTVTGEQHVTDGRPIRLYKSDAVAVSAIAYETGTAPATSGVIVDPGGMLILSPRGTTWPSTKVTLTYTHGTNTVPQRLVKACWLYVACTLQQELSGTSRDVISQAFDGATTRYSTPNKAEGRPTGWLDVDRLLNNMPTRVSGFA